MIRRSNLRAEWTGITALAFFLCGFTMPVFAQQADHLGQLEYRHIGPPGNRTAAVVGVPGDLNICYTGAASGGVWKSTDAGITWKPVFDDQSAQSIGSLAIAPSDPNVVWAGTGETFIRSNVSIGNGIYKSTDAGKTWKHMGLDETGRIGRIVIDPGDPNVVFAAAMGHCYGPQQDRGVFRTTDGGETWEKVLFVDENTGASDIAMDPGNPRILFAGMWQVDIKTWGRWSGGPGSGVFVSRDGGTIWKRLAGHGLPDTSMGKIAVAVAPSDSNRVYALIETEDGALWRSDDGGENWKLVSRNHLINERPHYYTRMAVASDDADELYFPCVRFTWSLDGGETIQGGQRSPNSPGGDNHDMWIDPLLPDRMMVGHDGGVSISTNRGKSWNKVVLPIAQMYHLAVDNQIPYFVYGNMQDSTPGWRAPSNSLQNIGTDGGGPIPSGLWTGIGGSECGFAIPDPVDPNIVWSGAYNAGLEVADMRTRHSRSVRVWPVSPMGWPAGELKYRFQWTFPIAISPHDHNKVYVGSQYVHQTTNGGHSWTEISPDLSNNDPEQLQDSGGITIDNLGVEYSCVIFAIAESPAEEGVIWAGTNDGQVQVTRDGGGGWINVTDNIPGLPPLGTVSNIEPSKHDAGTCYITVDLHQVNNRDPFIYKTTDYGESWMLITSGIPKSVFSYAHCVREDPVRKGLLYVGTENALYASFNDGGNWIPLQSNMPHAPVHWLAVQEHFGDLVVATYGRGIWIMDDLTPLQQFTREVIESDAHLFTPRPAYRFQSVLSTRGYPNDLCVGRNPSYGASINYYLKSVPEGDVKITILDDKGQTVRALDGTTELGINRIWWNLSHEAPKAAKLRTKPAGHEHVEFNEEGWRPIINWGVHGGQRGPLAVPGTYTVKLEVGETALSQNLIVKIDPHSDGTEADIQAQVKMWLEIRDDINSVVDAVNKIEWLRKQIGDFTEILERDEGASELIAAGAELDEKLIAVEEKLFQVHQLAGGSEDSFRAPMRLHGQLGILAGDVANGSDVNFNGAGDFPPTTQQVEAHEFLKKQLTAAENELEGLIGGEVPAFNQLLEENHIAGVITKTP